MLKNNLLPPFDLGFSALLEDLDARGLLDETLVVCLGEFGRTPTINAARRPRPLGRVQLGGAGRRRCAAGQVHGASDRQAAFPDAARLAGRPGGDDLPRPGHRPGDGRSTIREAPAVAAGPGTSASRIVVIQADRRRTPPPDPLPEAERGSQKLDWCLFSPSPLRGGGRGEGFFQRASLTAPPVPFDRPAINGR